VASHATRANHFPEAAAKTPLKLSSRRLPRPSPLQHGTGGFASTLCCTDRRICKTASMPISPASNTLPCEFGSQLLAAVRAVRRVLVAKFTMRPIAMTAPSFCPEKRAACNLPQLLHCASSVHPLEPVSVLRRKIDELRNVSCT